MEKKPDPKKVPNHLQIPNFISETLLNHFWAIFGPGHFLVNLDPFGSVISAPRTCVVLFNRFEDGSIEVDHLPDPSLLIGLEGCHVNRNHS